jgi:small subunit ribosomal protein S4
MSEFRGPRLRIFRRLGRLPAFTRKLPKQSKRHIKSTSGQKKKTQFAYRLIEKQKLLFYYGVSEKQLVKYVKTARKSQEVSGLFLLQLLARRLDNITFCLGLAPTLPFARQMVSHGHITVNQNRVTIPSFSCSQGSTITVQAPRTIQNWITENCSEQVLNVPTHVSLDKEKKIVSVNCQPDRREVPFNLNELLVVEYYSNRLLFKFKL